MKLTNFNILSYRHLIWNVFTFSLRKIDRCHFLMLTWTFCFTVLLFKPQPSNLKCASLQLEILEFYNGIYSLCPWPTFFYLNLQQHIWNIVIVLSPELNIDDCWCLIYFLFKLCTDVEFWNKNLRLLTELNIVSCWPRPWPTLLFFNYSKEIWKCSSVCLQNWLCPWHRPIF